MNNNIILIAGGSKSNKSILARKLCEGLIIQNLPYIDTTDVFGISCISEETEAILIENVNITFVDEIIRIFNNKEININIPNNSPRFIKTPLIVMTLNSFEKALEYVELTQVILKY